MNIKEFILLKKEITQIYLIIDLYQIKVKKIKILKNAKKDFGFFLRIKHKYINILKLNYQI